jgi:hypothetical protein
MSARMRMVILPSCMLQSSLSLQPAEQDLSVQRRADRR